MLVLILGPVDSARISASPDQPEKEHEPCCRTTKDNASPPSASASARTTSGRSVTTDDLFAGRTVVVFSLPGAFAPDLLLDRTRRATTSSPPRLRQRRRRILCVSVNDAFVMNEWARDQEADNVTLFPTATASSPQHGYAGRQRSRLGKRSWRYSMLVEGRRGRECSSSPKPGDPFEVSDADTMLAYINPKAKKPDQFGCSPARLPVLRQGEGAADGPRLRLRGDSWAHPRRRIVGAVTGRRPCRRCSSTAGTSAVSKRSSAGRARRRDAGDRRRWVAGGCPPSY